MIKKCDRPWDKKCRCDAHRAYFCSTLDIHNEALYREAWVFKPAEGIQIEILFIETSWTLSKNRHILFQHGTGHQVRHGGLVMDPVDAGDQPLTAEFRQNGHVLHADVR